MRVRTSLSVCRVCDRVGRYSDLPTVITAITRPYCNYSNYETLLCLVKLSVNATVITVITRPYCNYDTYEPPVPVDGALMLRHRCMHIISVVKY